MKRRRFFAVFMSVALTGGCAPSFEADLSEIEVTQRGLRIPAAPGLAPAGEVSVAAGFLLSSSDIAWAKRVNSHVLVHAIRIAPTDSQTRLDCISSASLTVAIYGRQETTIPVANYNRDPNASPGLDILVDLSAPVDITAVWAADKAVINLQATGQLPTQDWTVDLTLKLSGKITYSY